MDILEPPAVGDSLSPDTPKWVILLLQLFSQPIDQFFLYPSFSSLFSLFFYHIANVSFTFLHLSGSIRFCVRAQLHEYCWILAGWETAYDTWCSWISILYRWITSQEESGSKLKKKFLASDLRNMHNLLSKNMYKIRQRVSHRHIPYMDIL